MDKEKALKNQGSEFREVILKEGGSHKNLINMADDNTASFRLNNNTQKH